VATDLAGLRVSFVVGTLGQGGAERQLTYILRTLKAQGAVPRVLCLTRGEYWEEPIREMGIPVVWIGRRAPRSVRLAALVADLRRFRPDIVQSHHFYTNLYAEAAARLLRLPAIGAIRNNAMSEVSSNGRILGRLSLYAPRLIAANSRAGIRNAVAMGVPETRLQFLPNVIDTDRFRPDPADTLPADRPLQIATIGRLVEAKRIDRVLRVTAPLLRRPRAPVRLVIAGEGPLRETIEAEAHALGFGADEVSFTGPLADVRPLLRASDIFLLASDHEGTPNVVLEAMATGLPVVSTRVGDVEDIIRHGSTGFHYAPDDEAGLADGLRCFADDAAGRIEAGEAARRYICEQFSLSRLPGYLSELYARVVTPSSVPPAR
jgi:glycosyltransferase involved in cell wall biosynthesis